MEKKVRAQIAIVTPNTLAGIGLSAIIERMIPDAQVMLFNRFEMLKDADDGTFFHYFISARLLMEQASYFLQLERLHRTIVLCHDVQQPHLPQQLHTLNVCQEEEALVKDLLRLAAAGHKGHHPQHPHPQTDIPRTPLTPREVDVLRLIVSGFINKEIDDKLNISLTTVISHRKNLMEKLNIKSVSSLTIYAVTHGLIRAEEI